MNEIAGVWSSLGIGSNIGPDQSTSKASALWRGTGPGLGGKSKRSRCWLRAA